MQKASAAAQSLLRGLVAVIVAAVVWELAALYVQDPARAPTLLPLLQGIVRVYLINTFWGHAWSSLQSFLAGYALAAVIGIPLGLLLGFLRPARFALEPLVTALSVSPLVFLVPLITLWLGVGVNIIAIAFITACFPLAATIEVGLRLERGVPGASPSDSANAAASNAARAVVGGLRVAVIPAVVGVVIGEMFASQAGLGTTMLRASASIDVPLMVATFIVATVPSLVLVKILGALEMRLSQFQ
jgi:ABC-type nitrate/sulfonate/bicarbonate transport system permease component